MEPWAAAAVGFGSAIFFIGGSFILEKMEIDDPVDAIPCHFFCGIWGVLATGIFSNVSGVVYGFEGSLLFLAYQTCGVAAIMAWSGSVSLIYFYIVKKLGFLRVSPEVEKIGLDMAYLGGIGTVKMSEILLFYKMFKKEKTAQK